ncbi:hypothetical protein ROZALSC1DRAFT_28382, partial [Rozella allomycis CSF55]
MLSRNSTDKLYSNDKTTNGTSKTVLDISNLSGENFGIEISKIYYEYLRPGSQFELNIPFTVLQEFQKKMNEQDYINIFEPIKREVLRMVYQNTFPRYIQKQICNNKVIIIFNNMN